jgi:hypothetical protein
MVHQCPYCDLRFEDEWELKDHIQVDHPDKSAVDDDTTEE